MEDRCGNATEFVSKSCAEKPLKTKFAPLTRQMFWVNITGVEMDQHCIMIKAITDNGVSSKYATIEIILRRGTVGIQKACLLLTTFCSFDLFRVKSGR